MFVMPWGGGVARGEVISEIVFSFYFIFAGL